MFGLYIHIPYCLSKCPYCDFNSKPLDPKEMDRYVASLIEELRRFSLGSRRIVETLYLGGGTPSLLTEDQLTGLFDSVRASFTLFDDAEVTLEVNPGTLDPHKAKHLRSLGVNRISLGVQSLQDRLLSTLGRRHDAEMALAAFEILRAEGFSNIAVDLMYGLPGQSFDDWIADLDAVLKLAPEHLSLYCLSLESGTPFAVAEAEGRLIMPAEGDTIGMYESALKRTAAAGYEHYEISNYARAGYRSRHNCLYWTVQEYYGAGAGAHSFLSMDGPMRFCNERDPASYMRKMGKTGDPVARRELLPKKTLLGESLMLGLRMLEGVDMAGFYQRFGTDPLAYFSSPLRKALEHGWIELTPNELRLTHSGVLFSNEVFAEFF
ncbi:MAG: radical SAM family heme chaperone HemW [bacterium]|nr:radical SAM family heme chaperone HemW [bacterium]